MVKVLYLAGDGRSGSTLLNIALGNHDDVVATGELCNVYRYVFGQNNWCSCGVPVNDCGFWSGIRDSLRAYDPEEILRLQSRFESNRAAWRWPWLAGMNLNGFQTYQGFLLDLVRSVQEVSGKSILVDASKLPGRAMALASIPEVEFYLVNLVRDSRALVWARSKSWQQDLQNGIESNVPARSTSRVCFDWCKANLLTSLVRRQLHPSRSIRVRYEDFTTNPRSVLERIGEMLQVDFGKVATALQSGECLKKGHIGSGNRMRMGEVRLKPDFGWMDQLPSRSQAVAWALTGTLLRRYGYQRRLSFPSE